MNSGIQSSADSVSAAEEVLFKFQDLEITRNTLVIRFFEEKTVIPLNEITAYHLKWYLHDQSGDCRTTKYWFLILAVELTDGREESGAIAVAEFSNGDDEHELREDIEGNIAEAIDLALSWSGSFPRKLNGFARELANLTPLIGAD